MKYELPARQALPVRHEGVSGGPSEAGGRIKGIWKKLFLAAFLFLIHYSLFLIPAHAATNIIPDSPPIYNQWAWNDVIGWINFYSTNNVMVRGDKIEGYANNSSVGNISLDCATGPAGSNCSIAYNVTNDNFGNLSGWAWNENIGWISFNCGNDHDPITAGVQSFCATIDYKVIINPATGNFSGWTWNDVVGWISFNCGNDHDPITAGVQSFCATIDYKVKTSAGSNPVKANLTSSVFDTGSDDGGTMNSIMWRGSRPSGTNVKFQIASSNSVSGPWNFTGPDSTASTYYQPIDKDISREIKGHINKRYFRYKVFLETDLWQTYSPRVDDVIINYSP